MTKKLEAEIFFILNGKKKLKMKEYQAAAAHIPLYVLSKYDIDHIIMDR